MLTLTDSIPDDPNDRPFPIQRVSGSRPLQCVVTIPKPLGCSTHYFGGRTVPCTEPDCLACRSGVSRRFHLYLTCYDHRTQLHFLLELTAAAAEKILVYGREHGTTRGCGLKCTRIPATANGRIHVQTTPTDPTRYPIPEPPSLPAILGRMWNIPLPMIQTPDTLKVIPDLEVSNEKKLRHANRILQHVEGNGEHNR